MKSFEYNVLDVSTGLFSGIDNAKLAEQLNQLGRQGWEVQTTTSLTAGGTTNSLLIVLRREAS